MQEKNYKVYIHTFENGKVYIGITRQEPNKRWMNGKGYQQNVYLYRAIQKYGWKNIEHEILYDSLTKEEAESLEIQLISTYKANDTIHGYNIANGGNARGSVSERTKKLLSTQRMGDKNPMYGIQGREHPRSVQVSQYGMDGKLIKKWDCSADIEKELNIPKTKVIATCRGRRKSAGNFQWRYSSERIEQLEKYKKKSVLGADNPMYGRIGEINKRSKKVNQYSLDGQLIKEWESASTVDREIGISFRGISQCCNGNYKTSCGYIWKFAN